MQRLGTIRQIARYPIKSMAGENVKTTAVGWHGLDGDRRLAFRRIGDTSGFPWLSASKLPAMVAYRPYEQDGIVRVVTPAGRDLAADGAELRDEIAAGFGGPVELMHLKHGIFDDSPLSLITVATIRRLSEQSGVPYDVRRFRPNILVETPDERPFAEDAWVGRTLRCGDLQLTVTLRDLRCSMVNLDPDTGRADPRLLKATAELNEVYAGVYAVAVRTGTISVGDELHA
jgi:uncharacterized protein YcbX